MIATNLLGPSVNMHSLLSSYTAEYLFRSIAESFQADIEILSIKQVATSNQVLSAWPPRHL